MLHEKLTKAKHPQMAIVGRFSGQIVCFIEKL